MKRLPLLAFLIVAIAAAGVFYFKDQLFPKLTTNTVDNSAAAPSDAAPSPQAEEQRPCLVLVDELKSKDGAPLPYGPGEVVEVKGVADDGTAYEVDAATPHTLVQSSQCLLFNDQGLFDNFLNSTGEVSEFFGRSDPSTIPAEESAKFAILHSAEFLRKAALNPKAKAANWARFYAWFHLPEGTRMAFIGEMFEKVAALSEDSQPMPSSYLTQPDLDVYSKFQKPIKLTYVQHFCKAADPAVPGTEFILQDADNQSLDDVFDAALACVKQKRQGDVTSLSNLKLKSAERQQKLKDTIEHLDSEM